MFKFKKNRSRDKGMTLPEVLISVVLTGMICAALAMSITVVLRQTDNTTGRVNNARSEQSVSLWMPADLASADSVDTTAGALPCTLPCPPGANIGGSNALMLTWKSQVFDLATGLPVISITMVSYRYMQMGDEWVLVRVECVTVGSAATTCASQTVLHDLDAPPGAFTPGLSIPTWVIQVSKALDPASVDPSDTTPVDPSLKNKNGQRVVVTINGGGDGSGAGGGTNQISLSAGGTERHDNLNTTDNSGVPPFLAARSRCGGNFALVVDTSGSINQYQDNMGQNISGTPNWSTVRGSIYKFIEAFQGTPVKLELVKFSQSASVLGAAAGGQMYYDMLDSTQVAALKALVGYPNTLGGLQSGGKTNWEDAFYNVFKKTDGTIQPILPRMVIFFTDGVPTYSRIQTAGATMDAADAPLPGQDDDYYQVAWNRANRLMRPFDADVQSLIGMFVGSTTSTSPWQDSLGYHLSNWQRGYHSDYQRAYHLQYERGNNVIYQKGSHGVFARSDKVVWERGYHDDYQRGNNMVWEKGYRLTTIQRNNNVVFERSTTGLTYEKYASSTWSSISASTYFGSNTTPDSSDNYRVRITGTLGPTYTTTNMSQTTYDTTNTTADASDGFRTRVNGSLSGSWTTVTQAQYLASNIGVITDSSDGWRATATYSAPYDQWESTTQSTYGSSNTVPAETDGWRTRLTSASTSWTSVTQAEYTASNTTASDGTDGWQIAKSYTSPYSTWESTLQTTYNTNNTVPAETDGWRTRVNGTTSSWITILQPEYDASNTSVYPTAVTDGTDGFKYTPTYTAPYSYWETTTQVLYEAGNTSSASTDGWQTIEPVASTSWTTTMTLDQYNKSNTTSDSSDGWRITNAYSSPWDLWEGTTQTLYNAAPAAGRRLVPNYTSPYSSWEGTTEALYNANNTSWGTSDGWQATKVYVEPYTAYEASAVTDKLDKDILGKFVQPVGNPVTPITDGSGNVTNAATANLYTVANYAQLNSGMQAIALSECGGTLTIQTRLASTGASALDPFTYQNSISQTTVTTTSQFRGGTFDFQTTSSVNPTITPQISDDLDHYTPVGWSCTAKGQPRTFTTTPVPGQSPWQSITVAVSANEAVSCVQTVQWNP